MQNRLLQNLTAELEQLADIRNVSSPLSKSIQVEEDWFGSPRSAALDQQEPSEQG